ncbi:hypothetical protein BCAH1134_C0433 (plasmid) [Bacillus cereus AH1134]|nr:hypothetical protein BCAH1134_C0433 [Bacillus cereus AH1134]
MGKFSICHLLTLECCYLFIDDLNFNMTDTNSKRRNSKCFLLYLHSFQKEHFFN